MRLRLLGLLVTLALLLAPLTADAQQAGRVPRVGVMFGGAMSTVAPFAQAFREGLNALGYQEDRDIALEFRYAEGRFERFVDHAAELVRLKVDVIVAPTTPAALAAKKVTATIPIVTVTVADPVASGLVAALGRPGGNVTGLTLLPGPEIAGKQLELLKEAVPRVSRVAVLSNPDTPAHPPQLREVEGAARALRLDLQSMEVRRPDDLERTFGAMAGQRVGAVLVLADAMFFSERQGIAELAQRNRLPGMYGVREHAHDGGLMVYATNTRDLFRRAALYVDKILKGAKPGDLPVEQPTKFELVINLKTAKALGLTIPQSILIRADEVIQ